MTEARHTTIEPRSGRIARSIGAVLLIVLSVVCLTLSPIAVWGRNLVLDTDGYVSTVAPLSLNTQVQDAIIAAVDKHVDANLNIDAYLNQIIVSVGPNPSESPTLSKVAQRLAPSLKKAIQSLVNTLTTRLVQSAEFQRLWTQINQTAHKQLVSLLLTGQTVNGIIKIQKRNVLLDLSAVVSVVKQKLVDAGIGIAQRLPSFGATIVIAQAQDFGRMQTTVRTLNAVADVLPWLGLGLAALALLLAHRRARTVMWLGLGVAGGMCLLAIALAVAEHVLADELTSSGHQGSTVTVVYDIVVRDLRGAVRVLLVVALLVATAAWTARFLPTVHYLPAGMRDRILGIYRTPVPRFIRLWATPLEVVVVAILAAILILIESPPAALVVAFACLVAVWTAIVESCRRLAPAPIVGEVPGGTPPTNHVAEPPPKPEAH